MLAVGDKAPEFNLLDQDGQETTLATSRANVFSFGSIQPVRLMHSGRMQPPRPLSVI